MTFGVKISTEFVSIQVKYCMSEAAVYVRIQTRVYICFVYIDQLGLIRIRLTRLCSLVLIRLRARKQRSTHREDHSRVAGRFTWRIGVEF